MSSRPLLNTCRFIRDVICGRSLPWLTRVFGFKSLRSYNPNPHFGVFNFPLGKSFVKIELEPEAFSAEIARRESTPEGIRELFCPITYKTFCDTRYAILPRLKDFSGPKNCKPLADELLLALQDNGESRQLKLSESAELLDGLKVLERYLGSTVAGTIKQKVETILSSELMVGPVHGDFHFRNIVQDDSGRPLLIDADCFRPQGVQAFDSIYFALEASVLEHSASRGWLEELLAALSGDSTFAQWLLPPEGLKTEDALLLYFVERLGRRTDLFRSFLLVESSHYKALLIDSSQDKIKPRKTLPVPSNQAFIVRDTRPCLAKKQHNYDH